MVIGSNSEERERVSRDSSVGCVNRASKRYEDGAADDFSTFKSNSPFINGSPALAMSSKFEIVNSVPHVSIQIPVPPLRNGHLYKTVDARILKVFQKVRRGSQSSYIAVRRDGRRYEGRAKSLNRSEEGRQALDKFLQAQGSETESSDSALMSTRAGRKRVRPSSNFVDLAGLDTSDDEFTQPRRTVSQPQRSASQNRRELRTRHQAESDPDSEHASSDESETDDVSYRRLRPRVQPSRGGRLSRTRNKQRVSYSDRIRSSDDDEDSGSRRRGSILGKRKRLGHSRSSHVRRSERTQKNRPSMRELGENDIGEIEVDRPAAPKATGAREVFKKLPAENEFRGRHCMVCDTCGTMGDNPEKGDLIFCQSCTMTYHKICLGHRTNREHLVTKVGDGEFVLQCRRCIELVRKKDRTAPHQGRCCSCKKQGLASKPFRPRKSPSEEQKEREQNGGEDPIFKVSSTLVNNAENVLFRCRQCFQAFHLYHMRPKQDNPLEGDDPIQKSSHRFAEYSETWQCHDCEDRPVFPYPPARKAMVSGLIAWRPLPTAEYTGGHTVSQVNEDDKEYLVKWQNMSHDRCVWKAGSWVWGITPHAMRSAFAKRDNGNNLPTMNTEDAIPEDWLRIDIIFTIKYNNIVQAKIEEVDIARIKEVGRLFAKFKGLPYEEAVWTDPPDQEETERYEDFKSAYVDYVRGQYIRIPGPKKISSELQKLRPENESVRKLAFEKKVLLKEQPKALSGGELMDYQLEGINWVLFQWHRGQNAILADEMGLGKTIQVIGFLSALKENHSLAPFLIVVPNATCANWRREIKHWAPGLRVVTYFGSAKARELAMEYELFGDKGENPSRSTPNHSELRTHIVVTSFDAAAEPTNQAFFKRINWQALIVDEGQRLKSDKTILYNSLLTLKTPFKLLLTGTPLQNNQRELFNLLQFLDKSINASELEEEYANLSHELVKKLHEMIKPFFLRRTKAEVLSFLPPMAQIIVPLTMSKLQREIYKHILGKNADLLRAIMGKREGEKKQAITGLRNTLMQLRKVLCHPFVYSIEVEERTSDLQASHLQLVAASAKLMLLEIMLPKLRERGHRVLIFSQFLDNLTVVEDFMDGLGLVHLRLDGSQGSLEKQKVIDKFNAPDSEVFAMLLSTRAGGVGINLATADTVIILDPDFNPHQDIQAISRAHRIGQKNKVLVFKLMTRDSAEEKIMQVGKKKMVLDHIIIDQMGDDEADGNDLESMLTFGAAALFNDEAPQEIIYDSPSVDKLLDRSQIEEAKVGTDEEVTQESQFSFARIWQKETGEMGGGLDTNGQEDSADSNLWDKILAHRTKEAAIEQERINAALGRGKRTRGRVDYHDTGTYGRASDTDFAAKDSSDETSDADGNDGPGTDKQANESELHKDAINLTEKATRSPLPQMSASVQLKSKPKRKRSGKQFKRVEISVPPLDLVNDNIQLVPCLACKFEWGAHIPGNCPLKISGPEYCNLCCLAHFGFQRTCPHLKSETMVRKMLEALKTSPEDAELVKKAKEKLQGIKATLVQKKKQQRESIDQAVGKASEQRPGGFLPGPPLPHPMPYKTPTLNSSPQTTGAANGTGRYDHVPSGSVFGPHSRPLPSYPPPLPPPPPSLPWNWQHPMPPAGSYQPNYQPAPRQPSQGA